MTEQVTLPAFEGRNVTEAAVRVVHAGDGLSAALEVDPRPLGLSDEAAYVLIVTVVDVSHRTKDGKVVRVHTVKTNEIAELPLADAQKMIADAHDRIERLRDERSGQQRIDAEAKDPGPLHVVDGGGVVATLADADPFGAEDPFGAGPEEPDA